MDPRPIWNRLALVVRFVPAWLLQPIAGAARMAFFILYRRSLDRDQAHKGMSLWTQGPNANLYLERLKNALDVLDAHAPVYLRWLRSSFQSLFVSQIFMIMRRTTYPDYRARLILIHPYTVWKVSPEQLALYLAADATLGRLGRRFRRAGRAIPRANRRALREMVACARMVPLGEPLVTRWEQYLVEFDRQFPEAAA